MVTHISSLKNAATIVQQEAGHFNVTPCYSCQKGSVTILHMRKRDAHSQHMSTTVVQTRAYRPCCRNKQLNLHSYVDVTSCSCMQKGKGRPLKQTLSAAMNEQK